MSMRRFFTLKNRIILTFVAGLAGLFGSTALVSYRAISSLQSRSIDVAITANLAMVRMTLQNAIENLNRVSQQMALQGSTGTKLEQLLRSETAYERARLMDEMQTEATLIAFTNPSVGLLIYYFADGGDVLLDSSRLRGGFSPERLPLFAAYPGITYFGPHPSNDRLSDQYVLSAVRKVDLSMRDDVSIYVETNLRLAQGSFRMDPVSAGTLHVLLDNDGRVVFTEDSGVLSIGALFPASAAGPTTGALAGHYWFRAISNQGWSVVSLIAQKEYHRERDRWMDQMLVLLAVFATLAVLFSVLLRGMIYRPLDRFAREMRWIEEGNTHPGALRTNMPEYDELLDRFQDMKRQIVDLIAEIGARERMRADLEIEKLLYQIRPHFLMNTLDSVHWLAAANGQPEIDRIAVGLNKLLLYNLGRNGRAATVRDEIEALREYLALQQVRYDFAYEIAAPADETVLGAPIPRFLLQPLAENALHHGLRDGGRICVLVRSGDGVELVVQDNGAGMSPETIAAVLGPAGPNSGRAGGGIGLSYVRRMLESTYEGRAGLSIQSEVGRGTTVSIHLPADPDEVPA